jgi:hypothetical protein
MAGSLYAKHAAVAGLVEARPGVLSCSDVLSASSATAAMQNRHPAVKPAQCNCLQHFTVEWSQEMMLETDRSNSSPLPHYVLGESWSLAV